MKEQLLKARRLLAKCGWVGPMCEPWCRDHRGRAVHHQDEAVQTFSVSGALQVHGELAPPWELLGRVVSPRLAALNDYVAAHQVDPERLVWGGDWDGQAWTGTQWVDVEADGRWWQLQVAAAGEYLTFGGWLVQPPRTGDDVLRVFTTAVLRSARENRT